MPDGKIHQFGVVEQEEPPKHKLKVRQFGSGIYHTKVIKPDLSEGGTAPTPEDADELAKAKASAEEAAAKAKPA